jgi:hypothetical protein
MLCKETLSGGFTVNNQIIVSSLYMKNVQQKTIAQTWASPVSLSNSIQYYWIENNLLEKVMELNTADIACYVSIIGIISHKFSEHAFVSLESKQ